MIMLESRAELAESERDALLEAGRALTPRPPQELEAVKRALGMDGLEALQSAVEKHM